MADLVTKHGEAFCLMQYEADDHSETEVIWNSRDGVTPFVVTLRSGKSATHTRWGEDVRCSRSMADALGVRRFVSHTEATARPAAEAFVEKWWNHADYPMNRMFRDKAAAVEKFAADFIGDGDQPTLIEAGDHQ